ncbi:MAG: hypothetical protein Tsb0021_12060 [Chlamydiales bacterium]
MISVELASIQDPKNVLHNQIRNFLLVETRTSRSTLFGSVSYFILENMNFNSVVIHRNGNNWEALPKSGIILRIVKFAAAWIFSIATLGTLYMSAKKHYNRCLQNEGLLNITYVFSESNANLNLKRANEENARLKTANNLLSERYDELRRTEKLFPSVYILLEDYRSNRIPSLAKTFDDKFLDYFDSVLHDWQKENDVFVYPVICPDIGYRNLEGIIENFNELKSKRIAETNQYVFPVFENGVFSMFQIYNSKIYYYKPTPSSETANSSIRTIDQEVKDKITQLNLVSDYEIIYKEGPSDEWKAPYHMLADIMRTEQTIGDSKIIDQINTFLNHDSELDKYISDYFINQIKTSIESESENTLVKLLIQAKKTGKIERIAKEIDEETYNSTKTKLEELRNENILKSIVDTFIQTYTHRRLIEVS